MSLLFGAAFVFHNHSIIGSQIRKPAELPEELLAVCNDVVLSGTLNGVPNEASSLRTLRIFENQPLLVGASVLRY